MVIVNQRPMISLRDFAETLDATVDYQVDRDEIRISIDDTTVYLRPYSMTASVNARKVWLDMPVVIMDDVTYLPLRFMCDAFGLRCDWDPVTRRVIVINRWTMDRVVLLIDLDWDRREHRWQRDYDFHWYVNFHTSHNNHGYKRDDHGASQDGHNQHHDYSAPQNGHGQHYDGAPQNGHGQHNGGATNNDGAGKPDGHARPGTGNMKQHDGVGRPDGNVQHEAATPPAGGANQHGYNRPYGGKSSATSHQRESRSGDDSRQKARAHDDERQAQDKSAGKDSKDDKKDKKDKDDEKDNKDQSSGREHKSTGKH